MTRRRGQTDPFIPSRRRQWLLLSTVDGDIVSNTVLESGTDLRQEFLAALDQCRAQGWVLENEPRYPCVFLQKDMARRLLTLCQVDPKGAPLRHFTPWAPSNGSR